MEKSIWTKYGWVMIPTTENLQQSVFNTRKNPYGQDFEPKTKTNFFHLYQEINENIQAGTPSSIIDELPSSYRQLYQDTDRLYVTKNANAVLLSEDESEQQNLGSFEEDKDGHIDIELRKLETEGLVSWESTQEYSLFEPILLEQRRRNEQILEDYEELIETSESNGDFDLTEFYVQSCINDLESKVPTVKEFGYMLDSGITGKGYKSPNKSYKRVDSDWENSASLFADAREKTFDTLFHEVKMCTSKIEIWGTPIKDKEGKVSFSGGIMEKIRLHYHEDKEIREKWTEEKRKIARFKFISDWREQFEEELKTRGTTLKDEESLRRKLWIHFDTVYSPSKIEMDLLGKPKLIKGTPNSIWENNKQKDFQSLYLTKGQWKAIFQMRDIIIHRIEMDKKGFDEKREKAITALRESFSSIKTIEDLQDHVRDAHQRRWNKKEFSLTLIDQISIKDEEKWILAIRKLGRELTKKQ
jgi:hypothetical protein